MTASLPTPLDAASTMPRTAWLQNTLRRARRFGLHRRGRLRAPTDHRPHRRDADFVGGILRGDGRPEGLDSREGADEEKAADDEVTRTHVPSYRFETESSTSYAGSVRKSCRSSEVATCANSCRASGKCPRSKRA